jgi:hypothetical protein
MGEKVKRNHAVQFRHFQDEAYGKLSDPNLFSNRRELLANGFRCRRNGHPIPVGAKATLMPQPDGRVFVLCGNLLSGEVIEEDCTALIALNSQEPIVLVGEISEQSSVAGDFLVVCGPEVGEDDVDDPGGSAK